jgi:hypothetical protein
MNNINEKFWKACTGLAGVLIIMVIIFAIKEIKSIGYVGVNPNNTNTISVDGTGDAFAVPDVATFTFTVTENAKTVTLAQAQATARINSAMASVKAAGVADKDIQTTSYDINPHYDYTSSACVYVPSGTSVCPPGKSVLTGYDVSESIQVKVRDLTKAGDIFTSIGSLGVQNIGGLSFSVDSPDAVQSEARAKAIDNAKSKAGVLANSLGVSLVRIISFTENNNVPGPIVYNTMSMAVPSAKVVSAPDISAGQQKVTDTVTITYEIK